MGETREAGKSTRPVRALGVACLLPVLLVGCQKTAPPTVERPPAPVSVAAAVTQDAAVYLDEVGKCVAREVVSVQPQVSGRITAIHFADGADVKPGDPLFTIDPRPYRAQLDVAKIQFVRAGNLRQTKAIAQQDYDTRKNAVDVAQAQVEQGQAAVETARLNLDYTSIRSPINGRAGHRLVDLGNVVTANIGSLLMIQRLDPIYADFTVAENDLTTVQRHLAAGTLRVEVRLPDELDRPVVGQLTFLDNAVQDSTGTVMLRATVANGERRLWPGRFVKVRLVLSTVAGAVLVPAAAPQMSAKGPFVYVVKDDSTAELRPVRLGQRQGEFVVVAEGLRAGERVVINGQLGVTPGGKVRIEEPRAEPGTPAGGRS